MSFSATPRTKRKRAFDTFVWGALAAATFSLVLPTLAIFAVLVYRGAPALSWEFLTAMPREGMTAGGIFPAIVGTLWLVVLSLLFSCPVGVIAAIYLAEYAPDNRLTRTIHLAIIHLAGVPSIVHALFGVGAFVLFMHMGTSVLAASLTLGVMNLPIVIAASRESLAAVPRAYREACWSLGATRWQTIWHVVLPNSLSGILTGVIFAVSRAAGETAPILFTGVAFYLPELPSSLFDQCMALAMHLFTIATQIVGVPDAFPYATALVLVALVVIANGASIALRWRARTHRKL